ncbi:hypothetical protein C1H46_025128 [Malus baccata]|uniref:S-acyltransferase n=1 Tax=Malus baccata TaxID=106549 RepID=A0A540LSI7_MALBA|nr:hypothetical protein C1H46_025128 [Malus baccata]
MNDANAAGGKPLDKDVLGKDGTSKMSTSDGGKSPSEHSSCFLLACSPCAYVCNCSGSSEESLQQGEDGMFYCSLCEVEWLNNCIGKKNYRQFFTLMVTSLLLLILQWSTGIFVIICCIIERKHISVDISSKLGSSFSLAPFIIVVAACSLLAMIATLPIAQLFFFHILLIKKGISTYDYIIALREQEQEQQGVGGQQSAQMSPASSLTGLSSASSFNTFHRGAWCTPPRLFLEDQFDVVPPETGSVSSCGKKMAGGEPVKKKNAPVKISPWALARLNAEEVSKAAAEARKKSKILQPVRRDAPFVLERGSSFGGSSGRRMVPRPDNNRRRPTKRVRLPADLPMESITKGSAIAVDKGFSETSTSLAPLQLEARSAFQTSRAMSSSTGIVASSPESSLDSPDIHPFRVSSSGAEEARRLTGLPAGAIAAGQRGIPLSRSTSDGYEGYEASGGEDSDRVPTRIVQRSTNWSNLLFRSDQDERVVKLNASSSSGLANTRKL